jgi:D-alanyl-D-alanine carboxypeptidase
MKKSPEQILKFCRFQFLLAAGLVLFACGCRTAFTPLPPKETRTYQSILEWSHKNGMPGAILLVQTPKTNFLGVAGWADIKRIIPMRTDAEFRIGSITKMFAGITVARLQNDGLLDTDLVITNYLPKSITDHIANSDHITVRQLLRHQSGIYNYSSSQWWQINFLYLEHHGNWPPLRHLKYAYDQPASFPPGKGWEYSNSNFLLLGLILEKIAGHPLSVEIRQQILDPLELTNTYYELNEPCRGELAHGYEKLLGFRRDVTDWTPLVAGNSGLVSTVSDLAIVVRAICGTNHFLDGQTRELLRNEVRPESKYAGSRDLAYPVLGYDWGINIARAVDDNETPVSVAPVFFGHGGNVAGSLCFAWHDPKDDITIVWFGSSTLGFPTTHVWQFQQTLQKALFELAVEQTREK